MQIQLKDIHHLKYKRLFFTVSDNFLTRDVILNADINYCIQVPENVNNSLVEFYTLLINLGVSEEVIWTNIYHRTQDEIKSFISNQAFEHCVLFELTDKELNAFIDLFDDFARLKNIRKAEKHRLKAYQQNKILAVSFVKQNNEFICINFYRVTKERAANLYTFHLKHKDKNDLSASHFGRAHRALHWLDIKHFKDLGCKHYDFCGWYNGKEDESLLSINKFKEQFATNKIKEYSGVIYKSSVIRFLKKWL